MPLPKTANCHEHDMSIQKLESKIEVIDRHHNFYKEKFSGIELMLEELKYFSINTNNSIDKFKDIPEKVRKLEDKSLIVDFVNKLAWFIIGVLITNYIGQIVFSTTKERTNYKTEKIK
jgi:hypothetical protein